jgi:hypothetical protein
LDIAKHLEADVSTLGEFKQFAEHKPNTAEVTKLIEVHSQAVAKPVVQAICANVDDFLQTLNVRTNALHHSLP